jgi:hypothetical protein
VEHLEAVEQALRAYHIYGQRGLDETLGRIWADAVRRPDRWKDETDTERWSRFKKLYELLPTISSRSSDVLQLAQNAQALIQLTTGGG